MHSTYAAPRAWPGPLAMALVLLGLLAMPVPAHAQRSQARNEIAPADAGWHGRAIQDPRPRTRFARIDWPKGWSAGPVRLGTGYVRPGGSDRVREVQRRLVQLGYRPGAVDGLFGPRTRAATRWFQLKHGLELTGRVNRSTLAVLQARSDHKPLPTKASAEQKREEPRAAAESPAEPAPAPDQAVGTDTRIAITWLVAGLILLLALALGTLVGLVIPELRRLRDATAEPPPATPGALPRPAPVPAAPAAVTRPQPRSAIAAPPVLGYATADGEGDGADIATAAVALRCAHRGWSLLEVVHDRREPGHGIGDRPGLKYAINTIRHGTARGLVVAHIRDFTDRVTDLATLLEWLADAEAFLAAADHELDTSTRAGRGTAGAVIELARWERARVTSRTRDDIARGRFTPIQRPTSGDMADQIATMHERGLSFRAIADALNLAGIAGPADPPHWRITDVKAATRERRMS